MKKTLTTLTLLFSLLVTANPPKSLHPLKNYKLFNERLFVALPKCEYSAQDTTEDTVTEFSEINDCYVFKSTFEVIDVNDNESIKELFEVNMEEIEMKNLTNYQMITYENQFNQTINYVVESTYYDDNGEVIDKNKKSKDELKNYVVGFKYVAHIKAPEKTYQESVMVTLDILPNYYMIDDVDIPTTGLSVIESLILNPKTY